MGEHGRGWGERRGRGGGVHHHRANPPPPSQAATQAPPNPPQRNEGSPWSPGRRVTTRRSPMAKSPNPPPPPPPHGLRRPSSPPYPPTPPRPPPPPQTKTATPKVGGATAQKKDDRPDDPILRTVAHVPYPTGVEKGAVCGVHGRKGCAVGVESPGGTTLYEVARHVSGTANGPGQARKSSNPPPPQTKRLNSRSRTLQPNPPTPLTPHPDPRKHGTPLGCPMRCEGPHRDQMGHHGHAQHA